MSRYSGMILYSKADCKYCQYARQLFELHDIEYTELKLDKDFTKSEIKYLFPQWNTYPIIVQTFDDGHINFIGGFTELRELLDKNS